MSRDQTEFRLTVFVADTLRRFAPDTIWTHFPAGENRPAMAGARLKRMGLARGWPDFIFVLPDRTVAFLELKRPGGKLSPEQAAFSRRVVAAGCRFAVADSGEAAIETLQSWGILGQMRVAA